MKRQAERYLKGKTPLLGLTSEEVQKLFLGHERYRYRQAISGVMNGARDVESLSLLPRQLRDELIAGGVLVGRSQIDSTLESTDGTKKVASKLHDGLVIETAAIPSDNRLTVCVSSQVTSFVSAMLAHTESERSAVR